MDPTSLRCFLAASRLDSFRQAAEEVGLSQAAFSERIQRLEEAIGTKLFTRSRRAIELLPAGERLVPLAELALQALERCREIEAGRPVPYELTLGTRFELGMSWLVPALQELLDQAPLRRLHLSFGSGQDLLGRLQRGRIDAAVLSIRLTDPRFAFATLHREDYVFVGAPPRAQPITGGTDVRGETLLDTAPNQPLFSYVRDATQPDETWQFEKVERLGTIAAVRYRVLQGAGLAVLPTYFVRRDLEAGRLVRVAPEVPILADAFRLVWRAAGAHEERMLQLAEDLRAIPLT